MTPYHPSGKFSVAGLIIGLIVILLVAVVLGVIVAIVGNFFYLIPLFPILMAVASGFLGSKAVAMGKVRGWFLALIIGLLVGAALYGAYRVGEYGVALYNVVQEDRLGGKDNDILAGMQLAQTRYDSYLRRNFGQTGFIGFVLDMADQGLTITRGSSSNGTNLGTEITYIYWGLEILAVLGVAVYTAISQSNAPYNEGENRWVANEEFTPIGVVTRQQSKAFIKALSNQDVNMAASMMSLPTTGGIQVLIAKYKEETRELFIRLLDVTGSKPVVIRNGIISVPVYQHLVMRAQENAALQMGTNPQ